MTPDKKHADVMRAWLDGAVVQCFTGKVWRDDGEPGFESFVDYRVKPPEAERAPIKLKSNEQEMMKFYYAHEGDMMESAICLVKQVFRWELEAGSIVAREEFDRAVGDRKARDEAIMDQTITLLNEWLRVDPLNTSQMQFGLADFHRGIIMDRATEAAK